MNTYYARRFGAFKLPKVGDHYQNRGNRQKMSVIFCDGISVVLASLRTPTRRQLVPLITFFGSFDELIVEKKTRFKSAQLYRKYTYNPSRGYSLKITYFLPKKDLPNITHVPHGWTDTRYRAELDYFYDPK